MMLQSATCSNVTVWTPVGLCMAPITQFPHLAAKLADQGTQSQGTTSHSSSAAATARNSINQYVTDIHSQVQGEGQGTAAEFWQQRLSPSVCLLCYLTDSTGLISAPASQAFVERLFSVCGLLTVGRRNRMYTSLSMRAWLKVNYDELQDLL